MAVPKRQSDPNAIVAEVRTFFFSANAFEKRNLLQSDRMAMLLIDVLLKNAELGGFPLHAFVVMPDHLHVLPTVGRDITIEKAAQYIKGGFSFRAKRELNYVHELWQPGYSEKQIYEVEHYVRVLKYIHENPVKRGLVTRAEDFRNSSAALLDKMSCRPAHLRG
jgi:putative transposase